MLRTMSCAKAGSFGIDSIRRCNRCPHFMDVQALVEHLESPETLQQLLGDYRGDFSVGLGQDPHQPAGQLIVIVEVPPGTMPCAPASIRLGSAVLPVVVRDDLAPVHPLSDPARTLPSD